MTDGYEEDYESFADSCEQAGVSCPAPKGGRGGKKLKQSFPAKEAEVKKSEPGDFSSRVNGSGQGFKFSAGEEGFVIAFDPPSDRKNIADMKATGQPLPGVTLTVKIPEKGIGDPAEGTARTIHDIGRASVVYERSHDVIISGQEYVSQPLTGKTKKAHGDFVSNNAAYADFQTEFDTLKNTPNTRDVLAEFSSNGDKYSIYRNKNATERGDLYVVYEPKDPKSREGLVAKVHADDKEWVDPSKVELKVAPISEDGKTLLGSSSAGVEPVQNTVGAAAPTATKHKR